MQSHSPNPLLAPKSAMGMRTNGARRGEGPASCPTSRVVPGKRRDTPVPAYCSRDRLRPSGPDLRGHRDHGFHVGLSWPEQLAKSNNPKGLEEHSSRKKQEMVAGGAAKATACHSPDRRG